METLENLDPKVAAFKERVEQDWAGDETAAAWQRQYAQMREQLKLVTQAIVDAADLEPGMRVLDLASGTGEPALSIAKSVLPGGSVVASDFSEGMLKALKFNADAEGIANVETHQCDAHELPFDDASFDRVTSRFGVMFCGELDRALSGVRRVLKPAGKVAFLVWGKPEPGTYFGAAVAPFVKRLPEKPDPDGPGPMRFAEPGKLVGILRSAGFSDVQEQYHNLPSPYVGTPEQLFADLMELAAPFRNAVEALPKEDQEAGREEVLANLRELEKDGKVHVTSPVIIVTGVN